MPGWQLTVCGEESAEKVNSESNGAEKWLCPLCQKGVPDRQTLSLHLTEQHSVLPTCVDKLLDIATIKPLPGGGLHQEAPKSPVAELLHDKPSEVLSPDLCQSRDCSDGSFGDKKMDEERIIGQDEREAELETNDERHPTAAMQQPIEENKELNDATEKSVSTNDVPAENSTQSFKCLACQETFPSKTVLSVHYNSESHIQRMDPSVAAPSLPYVSNKPYQCAICRVSYNHAITLESHLKSVLHQSRSRNAGIVANPANSTVASSGSTTSTPNTQVNSTTTSSSQLVTSSNCAAPGTLMVTTAKDASQIHTPQVSHSLLSSPVASAQAVSAFLTLLTSSPSTISHSLLPSLFAHGAVPGAAAPQLVPQPQMVMPLILNGLQPQTQQLPESQQGQLLTQCVPFVGLNAAQQALLTQRLSSIQGQWPAAGVPTDTPPCLNEQNMSVNGKQESGSNGTADQKVSNESSCSAENLKKEKDEEDISDLAQVQNEESKVNSESNGDGLNVLKSTTNGTDPTNQMDSEDDKPVGANLSIACNWSLNNNVSPSASIPSNSSLSPVNLNLTLSPDSTPKKPLPGVSPRASLDAQKSASTLHSQIRMHCNTMGSILADLPALSEFQTEVLWAFFESRSEADAASPPREDCEALGREVGLSEEEVRKWLSLARYAKQKYKAKQQENQHSFTRTTQSSDNDFDDEERSLIIADVEDDTEAMDLTCSRGKRKRRVGHRDCCLTSDSENELYTSVVVSDEESQNGSLREGADSPVKNEAQQEVPGSKALAGGKVLRSSTVFLSDAEDEYEDEEGSDGHRSQRKKRKEALEHEVEVKKERDDPDVDLELEAQGDPPSTQSNSADQSSGDNLQSLPLSLTPFSTPFLSPYILSLAPTMIGDGSTVPVFPTPPTITRFPNALLSQSLTNTNQTSHFVSNGDECESALDLSVRKNKSSSSPLHADKIAAQKGQLLDGLGLRPTSKGLVVFQVKPDSARAVPTSDSGMALNSNHMAKSNIYTRMSEKMKNSISERDHTSEREEKDRDNDLQRKAKGKRYQDMRRSRTIIQAEQLDILYGCYFKDANPGKHEFEQIAEWVHLPKKVVQIWFQNMRARERKGEVRFISDGTLAAVGKPLIKFTWPLSKPIFSNKPTTTSPGSIAATPIVRTLIKSEKDPVKKMVKPVLCRKTAPVPIKPKETMTSLTVSTTGSGASAVPKIKAESTSNASVVNDSPKVNATLSTSPKESVVAMQINLKRKLEEESEEEKTDDEKDSENEMGTGPLSTNRMVPKLLPTSINNRSPAAPSAPQKQNGLNYWSSKVPIKINTLSRAQLALPIDQTSRNIPPPRTIPPPPTPSIAPVSPNTPNPLKVPIPRNPVASKQSPSETSFNAANRRPRTHLSCRQLSILQSCYETCAHPNAMECEAIGAELNLPLKVVQIWFQNTRAKEKRWRLQQEKSPVTDGKVDLSSGGYLEYSALKANRPILPKPIQLTITESSGGQSMQKEILTGRCDACNVSFESRAAARAHVFLRNHLATLKNSYFGQPATLVNKNASGNGGPGSVVPSTQVSSSPMVTSTGAVSEVKLVIDFPPPTVTSNS
ncbi:uncharacterized protein zfhx2 isoform 2-T2 [Synchiropus picturatus]